MQDGKTIPGGQMQFLMTTLAVFAGMVFSLAIALLVEELIFGKVLGRFFVRQTAPEREGNLDPGRVGRPPALRSPS
jgi:hypothetical protein